MSLSNKHSCFDSLKKMVIGSQWVNGDRSKNGVQLVWLSELWLDVDQLATW